MKQTLIIILIFQVLSCTTNAKWHELSEHVIDMRTIPLNKLTILEIGEYEIAYLRNDELDDNLDYPTSFAMGKLNKKKNGYKYITSIDGLSPLKNYNYIHSILNKFETDTTFVKVLISKNEIIRANIYRKVNINDLKLEFAMWKWVKSDINELNFETTEQMNQHLFN